MERFSIYNIYRNFGAALCNKEKQHQRQENFQFLIVLFNKMTQMIRKAN